MRLGSRATAEACARESVKKKTKLERETTKLYSFQATTMFAPSNDDDDARRRDDVRGSASSLKAEASLIFLKCYSCDVNTQELEEILV